MSSSNTNTGITVTDTGIAVPDALAIRTQRAADLRAIWGQDLDVTPFTPQGQIIDTETAIINDKNSQLQFVLNQFDPEKNEGIWQDGIGKIYLQTRKAAEPTRVMCQVTGKVGTVIYAGATVESEAGFEFYTEQAFTITSPSPMNLWFVCRTAGAVNCPAGTINRITRAIPGWDTVSNAEAGIIGVNAESRQAFEARRYATVGKNGHGNVDSIRGSLDNLTGVISAAVEENVKGYGRTLHGVWMDSHSVFISVYGGYNSQIAQTIYERIDSGCGQNGNTEVVIQTPTRYSTKPTHIIFNRPDTVRGQVKVTIEMHNAELTADIISEVRQRVVDAWNGEDGINLRMQINDEVYASRLYCSVRALTNNGVFFDIVNIKVRRQAGSGKTIYDSAFSIVDGYLEPHQLLSQETNPLFSYDAMDTMLSGKRPAAGTTANDSYFQYVAGEEYLTDRHDIVDDENIVWMDWADSFETSLNEFPILVPENVIILDESGIAL